MYRHEVVVQSPNAPGTVAAGIERLAGDAEFDRIRAIFAYATESGTQELIESLTRPWQGDWDAATKRWLISADFGFTEPLALRALAALPNSEVRIPDAPYLLGHMLKPRVTYHAKSLILDRRRSGKSGAPFGLLVGSANLTVSALSGNFEALTVSSWRDPIGKREEAALATAKSQVAEFERVWRGATQLDSRLLRQYEGAWKRVRKARQWPAQERQSLVKKARSRNASSFALAAALRSATKFWIQTGNMYNNLGEGGNQVDMQAGSRVFFGFSNRRVPRNHLFGPIDLAYLGSTPAPRKVRYGRNQMDKIYLPNPGTEGAPSTYVNETLLFERLENGSFRFRVGTAAERRTWKSSSERQNTAFKMRSGREFGVFS